MLVDYLIKDIEGISDYVYRGKVSEVRGMLVAISGIGQIVSKGDIVTMTTRDGRSVSAEVVGFREMKALAMPYGTLDGIGLGSTVEVTNAAPVIYPDQSWLGRVIDGMAQPIDKKGILLNGEIAYPLRNSPPPAHQRRRIVGKLDLGVRALNQFLSCCRGQRMGIFSGSGVGKSVLLSMIARYTTADVIIIGLVGERGRELQEFIHDELGEEGLKRSVVVAATSDQPALIRRQAAEVTLSVAEYFRDRGLQVLCLIDSVTRFAMAQREIGLSAGEPPASKGYTPTVFAELPRLLERAGPGTGAGSITGLFTVLVEGDDFNEPIADAVRGILDGHIVLDRAIAERGRYPAINVLRSISRMMPTCNTDVENMIVQKARGHLAAYEDMSEVIRLGAYRPGSDARTDEAIKYYPHLENFLSQGKNEYTDLETGYQQLDAILQSDGNDL